MADTIPISLFFQGNTRYGVGEITFDLLISESHNFNSTITQHPVEDGSEITDHIHNLMENGNITGIISNFSVSTDEISSNRAQDAFNALVALWQERTLVTIVSILRVYEDVAITSIPIIRDTNSAESLTVQISFQQIKVVKLQELELELSIRVDDLDSEQNRQVVDEIDAGRTVPIENNTGIIPV